MSAQRFEPSGALSGSLTPPPDKSISHRAALLGAMATGESRITGYLDSADTRSTLAAVDALGASVASSSGANGSLDVEVQGIGLDGPAKSAGADPLEIDVGNAGTLMRLLPGWLAGQPEGGWRLDGDESIRHRPVDRIAGPLREMGGEIECRDGRLPPLEMRGAQLRGIAYEMPVASAQVKSCVLLAGLMAEGTTTVIERDPSRDHTERMLRAAGARLSTAPEGSGLMLEGRLPGKRVSIERIDGLKPCGFSVPGDFSSAAFFIVAALIVPGSRIRLEGVGLNPTRVGLLGIINRMGARIEVEEDPPLGGEPRGAISVRHSHLKRTSVGAGEVPVAIDELPLVGLAAAFAEGETVVRGAAELRHKESDRVATVVEALNTLGGDVEAFDDGFAVRGTGGLRGGVVSSHGDHRLSMMGAIAGLASRDGVEVDGMDAAGVSYPGFEADLASLLTHNSARELD
ncbi:MAG: 3-phosphoshikimate 1-carboxyvinyltransferase [Actinomycetota bacterium]|nr:3-phosphoshikimate 1-carboxyvinyltransferase [Actinomycetota bacterium]